MSALQYLKLIHARLTPFGGGFGRFLEKTPLKKYVNFWRVTAGNAPSEV